MVDVVGDRAFLLFLIRQHALKHGLDLGSVEVEVGLEYVCLIQKSRTVSVCLRS